MKKTIIIVLSLLLLCGCENKSETKEIEDKEKIYIKYQDKEITADKFVNSIDSSIFNLMMENIRNEMLENTFKDKKEVLDKAEDYANDTMNQLKDYYKDDLENTINEFTGFNSIEEYKEYLKFSYLEEEYINNYILENNEINIKEKDEIDKSIYYRYYYEALDKLFKDNKLSFHNRNLKEQYNTYMEDLKEFALNNVQQATEE